MAAISSRLARGLAREVERKLGKRVAAGAVGISRRKTVGGWQVCGDTCCARDGAVRAELTVTIAPDWMIRAPNVQARASFMKHEMEWHANASGICYVHPAQWFDEHLKRVAHFRAKDPDDAIKWTAGWLLDSVDNLVHKHFLGWQGDLPGWNTDWPAWLHAEDGLRQYEEEKKSGGE